MLGSARPYATLDHHQGRLHMSDSVPNVPGASVDQLDDAAARAREDRSKAIQELAARDTQQAGFTSYARNVDIARHPLDERQGELQNTFNDAARATTKEENAAQSQAESIEGRDTDPPAQLAVDESKDSEAKAREDRSKALQELAKQDSMQTGVASYARDVDLARHPMDEKQGELKQAFDDASKNSPGNEVDKQGSREATERTEQAQLSDADARSRKIEELAKKDQAGLGNGPSYGNGPGLGH